MKKLLQMKFMLLLCALIVGSGTMWAADPTNVTINFGTTTGYWAAHSNDNYTDSDNRTWKRTCSVSNMSGQKEYSQFGNASNACGSLVFTAIAGKNMTVSAFSVTMAGASGGNSPTTGTIYLYKKSGETETQLATASVNGTNSVTCSIESSQSFSSTDILKVSYAGTAKAIRISKLEYSYTTSGGDQPTTWTVTYDGNGASSGTVPVDNTEYNAQNNTVTVLGNTGSLAKTGCAFSGWNTQANGGGTNYDADDTFTISANTTLYAKWTPYTITALSNKESYGTVSLSDNVITGSPNSGYRYANPAYTVAPENSATVAQDGNIFTVTPTANTTITINFEAIPTHTATFSVNGTTTTTDFQEGAAITFPANPADIDEKSFVGWATDAIVGTTETAPEFVTSATMGEADITYYAVFAEKTETTGDVTKAYGFETESDSDWTIDGPARTEGEANTGNYSGKINTNNTYVTFNNKVKVKEFSFAFKKTSNNNNYNVYIETSTDNTSWTAAATYPMSDFGNGTYTTKNKTFDGNTEMYVRFHCSNTTAVRYVDDVTIKYDGTTISYSGYCTTVAADTREEADLSYSEGEVEIELKNESYNAVSDNSNPLNNPYNLNLTWSSSDETVATVNENGIVTLKAVGTTTITASFAGNDAYKPGSASFTLQVVDTRSDATVEFRDANNEPITELNIQKGEVAQGITPYCSVEGFTFTQNDMVPSWEGETMPAAYDLQSNSVTSIAVGTMTYTATFLGDETYKPASATLTINVTEVPATYTLAHSITPGKHYVIASGDVGTVYVMGKQKSTNRDVVSGAEVNFSEVLSVTEDIAADVREFIISKDGNYYTIFDESESGYLFASSTSANHLKTQATNNANGQWTITIDEEGIATLKANMIGHNWMRFNKNSEVFSCYGENSNQQDIYLFEKDNDEGSLVIPIAAACTDGTKCYATFSSTKPFVVPEDLTVSEIGIDTDGTMNVENYETGAVVPANTGVMVSAAAGDRSYVANVSTEVGNNVLNGDNRLRPTGDNGLTATEMNSAEPETCKFYRLTMHGAAENNPGKIGFWWGATGGAAFKVDANKAYMAVPASSGAREGFAFDDDSTTGISNVNVNENVNGSVFDLQGRKVSTPGKGLYIVNGKKVVIK